MFRQPTISGPLRFDEDTNVKFVKRAVNNASTGYKGVIAWDAIHSKTVRPRLLNKYMTSTEEHVAMTNSGSSLQETDQATDGINSAYDSRNIDSADLAQQIAQALQEDDRI